MEAYSNQIANLFSNKFRLKKGDCVALFMTNCPEYVGIWLGLSKIGVIPALINSNLKHQPLRHCIAVARAQLLIYNTSLQASVATVLNDLEPDIRLIANTDCDPASTKPLSSALVLESTLSYVSTEVEYALDSPIQPNDTIMYVYTSGTTGLPKPAVIKQSRYFGAAYGMSLLGNVSASDRVFVTLPIYHGNGFFIGIGAAIVGGATCVLRKKFSASSFLKEVIDTEVKHLIFAPVHKRLSFDIYESG
jgi:acyl-CoA synthetase (AMP-forming)/AMP-acid ligase II